ncbi:ACP S-malonyltransferase [Streptomyces sp. NPDC002520]
MSNSSVAFLFPGQGSYQPGFIGELIARCPGAAEPFETIARVVREDGGPSLLDLVCRDPAPTLAELVAGHPDALQYAIYGTGVALHAVLGEAGIRPDLLIGHSFGEIAALQCAGAYSAGDGARIVRARNQVLREFAPRSAAMLAVNAPEEQAAHIAAQAGPNLVIACFNSSRQQVLSGPGEEIAEAMAVAAALGVDATKLASPYAFHHPGLTPAVRPMIELTAGIRRNTPRVTVFSPILRRCYGPDDDVVSMLAEDLVHPVHFTAAVRFAGELGMSRFFECGASVALSAFVRHGLPGAVARPPRYRPGRLREDLGRIIDALRRVPADTTDR